MSDLCVKQTGSSNKYEANGNEYFFETSRTEHGDGAITGQIWKYLKDGSGRVTKSGSFRIEGDGKISRGPAIFKKMTILHVEFNGIRELWRGGEVTEENLNQYVADWQKSYKPGGCNEHIGYGDKQRFPIVGITDLEGKLLLTWKAPSFVVD
jgi:hypothetical protein